MALFDGHVSVRDDTIFLRATGKFFESRLKPFESMEFKYADAVLEIKALGYRVVFYEPDM